MDLGLVDRVASLHLTPTLYAGQCAVSRAFAVPVHRMRGMTLPWVTYGRAICLWEAHNRGL
jgi:hypothetical protein